MDFGASRESIVDAGVVSASANGILARDHDQEFHRLRPNRLDVFSMT